MSEESFENAAPASSPPARATGEIDSVSEIAGAAPDLKFTKRRKPARSEARVDRLPPSSPENEQGILGCILLSPNDCLAQCIEKVDADDFYDLRHAAIFARLLEMYEERVPVDIISLQQNLKDWGQLDEVGGIPYLNQLQDCVPSAANLSYYLDIVVEKALLRKAIGTCTDFVGKVYEYSGEVDSLMDELERDVMNLTQTRAEEPARAIGDGVQTAISTIESYSNESGVPGAIATGFVDLDRTLLGGMKPGQMIVIAARPSVGKTSLMANVAEYVAINLRLPVGVFSLEMTYDELTLRMICSRGRVNLRNITDGFIADSDYPRLTAAAGAIRTAPIYIDDTPGLSILKLKARARRMVQKWGLKLLCIDYLQLMHSTSKRAQENRQIEITEISSGIKELAKELGIPIIILSQLNRDVEKGTKRKPRLSDLRESGCLSVKTTKMLTADGVQCNNPSRMNTYSLSKSGNVIVRPSKNIPKPVKPMVRVVLKSGRYLDCTPNHPILTEFGFIPASKIRKGVSVASVRKINSGTGKQTIKEAKWIGWMLGNGSTVGYSSPSFICSDKITADEFCSTTKELFGLYPNPHKHWSNEVFQFDITAGPVRTSAGNPCKNWLRQNDLWGRHSWEKKIPDWFMELADDKSISELLAGLVETDGSVCKNVIKFSTTSNEMAWQVVWCFARLGIFCYLDNGFLSRIAKHTCFTVRIADGRDVAKFRSLVTLNGRKGDRLKALKLSAEGTNHGDRLGVWVGGQIKKAMSEAGLSWRELGYRVQGRRISQDYLKRVLEKLPNLKKKIGHLVSPDIYWDQLDSIHKIDDGEVFDREVIGGPHNFVANGIIVHNSIEQDADVVGLLYKPKEDDDEGEMGVGINLLIAKQRSGPLRDIPMVFLKPFTRFEVAAAVNDEEVPGQRRETQGELG